ncbi:hypothetical protein [Demequina sp. NBRC 110053]|uniref:hypothetical protein n=1 Tax=Demequina sp. NBRC 110053 TaxID=1570342 RepID=UPI0013564CA0|nr:hypothetical protein [Demequina sp. NBRC 110053]
MTEHAYREPAEDERGPMTLDERSVWVYLVVLIATTVTYAAVVIPRALAGPIEDVEWVVPMIWAIGISIVGTVVGSILGAIGSAVGLAARGRDPETDLSSDERDKEIERLGNRSTQGVIGAGMLAALVLAMVDADSFWIGNALFVTGAIAGLVETIVKIRAYRRGF